MYMYIYLYIYRYMYMFIYDNSHKKYLVLYTRVTTHLIMACSKGTAKGKEAEDNQPNARMRTHGDNPRYTCQELTSLFV